MTLYNAQNQPIAPTPKPDPAPQGFEEVSSDTPIPDNTSRFKLGERLPWKGLVFELRAFKGNMLLLEVVDVTAGSKRKQRKRKGGAR